VRKALAMLNDLKVPVLGLVENMSFYRCPDCGAEHEIFCPSHVGEIAAAAGVPVWARLPVRPEVTGLCDSGQAEKLDFPELQALVSHLAQPAAAVR
jgi:Mrp family chromosome partitioning ATPase